jgi:hypothetical protein
MKVYLKTEKETPAEIFKRDFLTAVKLGKNGVILDDSGTAYSNNKYDSIDCRRHTLIQDFCLLFFKLFLLKNDQ